MILSVTNTLLSENVKLLKSEVSKTALQGVLIAIAAIIIGTCFSSLLITGEISLAGIVIVQKQNSVLWVLDCIPFIFGFWGQYSSSMIAYQAGALVFEQTEDLRNKTNDLVKQANYINTHDLVTDLPNRNLFYDRVARAIISVTNNSQLLAILLVEIENFKEVYDTLGRNSSDVILKQLSTRLQAVSPEQDCVAKIDGNVFGILLTSFTDISEIDRLAQAIQSALEKPFMVERLAFSVHSNVGIVHFPEHGDDVDALVQRAGVALELAQSAHKGYAFYSPELDKHSTKRLTLMSELRRAIERNELVLFYQAKMTIKTGKLYGAEALLRWQHPIHGLISPDEFIEMAERTRLITQVTPWVLKQSFQDAAQWHKQGKDLKISVNLSTKDLHDPELPDVITGIAAATGIKPEWIMLEITESSVMRDPEHALEIIKRLHKIGYQFSMDDFGTGYSSLAYLKKMPLTELKIDRSFVSDILSSENDAVIVNATINLAHNLGLQVTAEGVESKEIIDKLSEYGCDIAQGYYLNKPMSFENFNQWLADRP
ncbi:MAG: bifunctional diguanylate cyclase/phosphodiesterase [Methylovulum sp.]|jgi:diguanylate cyclase (GGDEF)-like protein|nr:bifunctional diguanylate cyclase/phosphodiesterase [Methylovulum sp.]MCF7999890.1 bifunctional diguanylate cyclase/phosphodiesterase [Methylovulum sp.]